MNRLFAALLLASIPTAASAQTASPNLKGTWKGTYKSVVYGHNIHHPGNNPVADSPRVREVPFTYEIEGQDGTAVWGKNWSDPSQKDLTAFTLSSDNRTLLGADSDGFHRLTILSEDRMEACFVMNGQSPTGAIVAGCAILERQRQ